MAGIGFEISKLARKDDLLGIVGAYFHSAMATAGPWLFSVIALAIISYMYGGMENSPEGVEGLMHFRGVIVYNFSISLVMAAPIFMLITRFLADHIHVKDVTSTPTVMFESLLMIYGLTLPVALFFYGYYFEISLGLRLAGFSNMFLLATVWLLGVYMIALKEYNSVTRAFLGGMLIAILCCWLLKDSFQAAGMVAGFSLGLGYIVFILAARIFSEYPYRMTSKFSLIPYFKKYWELPLAGLFYNAGVWVDKWLMWYSKDGVELGTSNIHFFPEYDSAMFFAYLTVVPSLALFVFSVETNFFHHYRRFYMDILSHVPMARIRENHRWLTESVYEGARNIVFLQGAVTLFAIILSESLMLYILADNVSVAIFRIGCVGAFFHALMLFLTTIQSYFDCRKAIMWVWLYFFGANTLFTLISLQLGQEYYGMGYLLAAMTSFGLSAILLFYHLRNLPYHAFITNNNSVRNSKNKTMASHEIPYPY